MKTGSPSLLYRTVISILTLAMMGCASGEKQVTEPPPDKPALSVSDEVSLKSDRTQYEDLRKEIPEDVRRENDQLAFIRGLMKEGDEEPGKIRERFHKEARSRRDKFSKAANKRRDEFNRNEKRSRDEFLKKLKAEREAFMKENSKVKSEKRKEFFDEQEAQRQDFFNDQKDHRKDFEAHETEARKDFEAYITERTDQFNHEMREYQTNYYDRKKNVDLKKRADEKAKQLAREAAKRADAAEGRSEGGGPASAGSHPKTDADIEEFNKIPKTPGTPLTPPGDK